MLPSVPLLASIPGSWRPEGAVTAVPPVADTTVLSDVEGEATEIRLLAHSRVPTVLRELRALHVEQNAPTRRQVRPRDVRMLRDMAWRVFRGVLGPDAATQRAARITETQERLGTLLEQLTLKIEQFLALTLLAGSPPEYQQDLRGSRDTLSQLIHAGAQDKGMTLDTFKTLSHIVDLVELTRRDVERRSLDNVTLAARFAAASFPTDRPDAVSEIMGVSGDRLSDILAGHDGGADPETERRIRLVAQLVYDLRFSHTPEGLLNWFHQPFPELGGETPVRALDDPDLQTELRTYARSLRSQFAT
jgi:hypothetical protein